MSCEHWNGNGTCGDCRPTWRPSDGAPARQPTLLEIEALVGPDSKTREKFRTELAALLNRHSFENGSNTPDHVLAKYMLACLDAFDTATRARDKWYGIEPRPGMHSEEKRP